MFIISVFFVLAALLSAASAEKLSSAKLLLPYHPSIPISYTLEVTEADPATCYRWYSSKPGVVSVDAVESWLSDNTMCSHKAIVVSKSQTVTRNMAVVFAENVQTRQVLKCHVVVEKVKTIMIDSKSRELYLEDSPEPFKVIAMDEEGNMFSTLGGLPFEWLLLADTASDASLSSSTTPSQILRLVRYADTSYNAPDDISALEATGARGHMVLLEGLQTGVAFISAKIKDSLYRDVPETHVKLRVVANLQLLPGEVYLMPEAVATIRAFMFRQNRPSPLHLPSSQYSAFVGDSSVAVFDEKSASIRAVNLGATNVTLLDKNIQIKDDYVPPSSFVYVEKPASIRMSVIQYPHAASPWILEAGREYEFQIDILDRLGHVLVLPDAFSISCIIPLEFFEITKTVKNGTIWLVKTRQDKVGESVIPVSANWSFKTFKVLLEHSQDFVVFAPIVVYPKVFGLPLVTSVENSVGYTLHVSGGSGHYFFMSSDNKVVTVDATGFIRSVALEPGSAEVKVIDQRNNKHFAISTVVVGDIINVEFSLDSRNEELVGNKLTVGIRGNVLWGQKKIPIANCSVIKFGLELTRFALQDSAEADDHSDVFKLAGVFPPLKATPGRSLDCALVVASTLRPGFSELKIKSPLQASVIISAYSNLRTDVITEYGVSEIVTALGTRIRVPILGGPLIWPSERERHIVTVEPQMTESKRRALFDLDYSFSWNSKAVEISAECRKYGDYSLLVTVGNVRPQFDSSLNSHYEKLTVVISCPEPHSMQLSIPWGIDSEKGQPPCPAAMDSTLPFPVLVSDTFPVAISVYDVNNRRFINISSFEMQWSFDKGLISCSQNEKNTPCNDLSYDRAFHRTVHPLKSRATGDETVRVGLLGYLTAFGINLEQAKLLSKEKLAASLALRVVDAARLLDTSIVLFTIPAATKKVQVIDGSGYFQFNIQERSFVNQHVASTIQSDFRTLSVNPYGKGTFMVEVSDLCLRPGSHRNLVVEIKVLSIDKLVVIGRRFIAIGETLNIGVVASDASGHHYLPADMYSSISLKPVYAEDKISVVATNFFNSIAVFSITGKAAGVAKLVFTATGSPAKQSLTSPEDFAIEVCLPVGISPSPRLILMDGASYQLAIVGGPVSISPKPAVSFRFADGSHTDAVSLDKNSGLLHGSKIGDARIEAVLYDTDPLAAKLGKNSVIEVVTAPLAVEVRPLTAIHLASPSTTVDVGSLMPVTVFGLYDTNDQRYSLDFNPGGFGTATPPLHFSWSVSPSGPKVELVSPLFGPLYSRPLEEDFTVYFRSATPGDYVITVHTARPQQPGFRNLTATISLSAVQPFRIGTVQPPFMVSVGSELHLPISGTCSQNEGHPKYSLLGPSTSCRNGTFSEHSSVTLGPTNSFVGVSPGHAVFIARCSSSEFLSFSFDVRPHFSYVVIEFPKTYHQPAAAASSKILGLPYGAAVNLDIGYYTQSGHAFDAVAGQFSCRLNRRDAVTFYLPSGTPKVVTVDISLASSVSVAACESVSAFPLYLAVVSRPAITPFSATVNVGDLICFRHLLDSAPEDIAEEWSTSDQNNLFIDSKKGMAVALSSSGKETISVLLDKKLRASSPVAIRAVSRIDFMPHQPTVISDATSNNTAVFDLLIEDAFHRRPLMSGSCPVNVNLPANFPLPVVCELSSPDSFHRLFAVSTYFDSLSSPPSVKYHCQVRYLGSDQNLMTEVGIHSPEDFATMDIPLRLYASFTSQSEFAERQFTELNFLPSIYLSTTTLHLDAHSQSGNLTVSASERVFRSLVVMPSHSSFVSVTGPTVISGQTGRYNFEISLAAHRKVPSNLVDKLNLLVRVPLLNQEQVVSIVLPSSYTSFTRDGSASAEENLFSRFFGSTSPTVLLAYIVVAGIVLLLTLHLTFRGGFFAQPNFVQTVYTYEPETTLQEERRLLRQTRVKQARQLANVSAKRIRDRVRFTRETLQKEAEDVVFRKLVAKQAAMIEAAAETVEMTYEVEVGRAYKEALHVEKKQKAAAVAGHLANIRESKRALQRFEEAKASLDSERAESKKEEIYRRLAKQSALEIEMERTRAVLSRPPPPKNEVEKVAAELEENKRRPFRVLESNVYQATRLHLGYDIEDGRPVKEHPEKLEQTKVSRRKAVAFNVDIDDGDAKPPNPSTNRAPQPTKLESFPFVEQPPSKDAALTVTKPVTDIAEKEAEAQKRREMLMEKSRARGEAALKQEKDSRHFEKLLSDLTNLQQVWRRHDVNTQPHSVAGRLYVSADQVEAEKRAQQNRLEAAFHPVVKAAVATLPAPPPPPPSEKSSEKVPFSPSSVTTESMTESSESAIGDSKVASFCWQEASVTTEERETTTTEQSSSYTDYVAESEATTHVSSVSDEPKGSTETEQLPALEPQSPLTNNDMRQSPFPKAGVTEVSSSSLSSSSDNIETGALQTQSSPNEAYDSTTSSNSVISNVAGSIKSGDQADRNITTTSSFDWLMEHNRLLMAKIESHRRQIDDQRQALGKRLAQLNVAVTSPLHRNASLSTHSAPSTGQHVGEDRSIILFSPSYTSSFLSDGTPKRLPPQAAGRSGASSSSSSSSDSSVMSTGPLSVSSSSSSSSSSPRDASTGSIQRRVLSTLPEEPSSLAVAGGVAANSHHEFSLLVEQTVSSMSSVVAAGGSSVNHFGMGHGSGSVGQADSVSIASVLDFYPSRRNGASSPNSDARQAPFPALSSTPRREAFSSSPNGTSSRRDDIGPSSFNRPAPPGSNSRESEPSPPYRSLLVDGAEEDEEEDDFDLPPPSLVGDESFLGQLP